MAKQETQIEKRAQIMIDTLSARDQSLELDIRLIHERFDKGYDRKGYLSDDEIRRRDAQVALVSEKKRPLAAAMQALKIVLDSTLSKFTWGELEVTFDFSEISADSGQARKTEDHGVINI